MLRCDYCGKSINHRDISNMASLTYRVYCGHKLECKQCAQESKQEREQLYSAALREQTAWWKEKIQCFQSGTRIKIARQDIIPRQMTTHSQADNGLWFFFHGDSHSYTWEYILPSSTCKKGKPLWNFMMTAFGNIVRTVKQKYLLNTGTASLSRSVLSVGKRS